jgi:SNF2 family DNA or RNA helicase
MTRTLIPFEPIQQQAYEAALDSLIVDLRGEDARGFVRRLASYFARRAALLQICSFPASVVPEYLETPAKLAALDRILDELVGKRREKVVVWSFYQASVEAVSRRYEKYGTVKFDGTVSSIQARREAVRRFQDDDETFVFVGNPAAAGAGLTLHRAAIAIYESLPNQAAHFLQSVDRIHRRGQTRDVEVVVLLCRGSIEELEYERLLRKQSAQRELLGDAGDPSATREAMLEELLAAKQLLSERLS